jgi:hypothetical protein
MKEDQVNFAYISKQFNRCKRDANSVIAWLTGPPGAGEKGIPHAIAVEVMLEFAERIDAGEVFGFTVKNNLSMLSLAVLKECEKRKAAADAELHTKTLLTLRDRSFVEDEIADDMFGMLAAVYERLDEMQGGPKKRRKAGKKAYRRKNSIWFKPLGEVFKRKKQK